MTLDAVQLAVVLVAFLAGAGVALLLSAGLAWACSRAGVFGKPEEREAQEARIRKLEADLEDARAAILNMAHNMRADGRKGAGRALTGTDDVPAPHGRPPLPADDRDQEIMDTLEGVGGDVAAPRSSPVG